MNNEKITVSAGNGKMGEIPSVSLPPVKTCRPGAPCVNGGCYACKLCRIYPTVRESYEKNLAILNADPDSYFLQLRAALMINRFFRVHVSGDIPTADYFARLIDTVRAVPSCRVLMFTKQYEIVNDFLDAGGEIPENLQVIFSGWNGWKCENPYNLPESEVIFKGQTPPENWKICGGNCAACACAGVGCWEIKRGEVIAFYKH